MSKTRIMGSMTARDISKNLLQYLSMIIITMLAVTLFCGFISNSETLRKTLDDYYESSNLTDLICQYSSLTAADKSFLEAPSTGAEAVEYRIYSEGGVGRRSAKIFICHPQNKISLPLITSGARGVLIDAHVAEKNSLSSGSEVDVQTSLGSVRLTVTGVMTFAETAETNTYFPVYIDSDVFFAALFPALSEPQAAALFNDYCNQALIKAADSEAVKAAINARYAELGTSGFVFAIGRSSMESVVMLDNEITQSQNMIYVFPVIFMLVSVLVILSTVGPLILRERTNIGTLKSIGISDARILLHYSLFGAALCFIGGVLGVIAGPLIVPNVLLIKYGIIYSLPAFSRIVFSPLWSFAAVFTVCALAAVMGCVICYKTVREKPAACMRPAPPRDNPLLNRTGGGIKGGRAMQRGLPFKMALRNILVKPSRAIMTAIGVTGCVALLVCSFGIGDSVENSINYELGGQFKYDINSSFTIEQSAGFLALAEELKAEGEIEYYEVYKTFYMAAKGERIKDIKIYALPPAPRLTTINPDGKVFISKSVAEDLSTGAGKTVTLSAAGNSYTLKIDGVIENSFSKGIYLSDAESLFEGAYFTYGMWIESPSAGSALTDKLNAQNGTRGAVTMAQLRSDIDKAISSIQTIKLTMIVFAVALSVVVLYNLSLLNIRERSRDIATMKVLGFTVWQIAQTLLYEIMILVATGTIFGLLLGYPMTVLVMSLNRIEVLTFIYKVTPLTYALSALISVITALGINLLFMRPIRKINMIESLKSVE